MDLIRTKLYDTTLTSIALFVTNLFKIQSTNTLCYYLSFGADWITTC